MEISHRSTCVELADRLLGSTRPCTVLKPIERPSIAPALISASSSRPALTSGIKPPARVKSAQILDQLEPHPDRLGRVVLEQHRDAAHAAQLQRLANAPAITMSRAWSISPNRLA